ncbi:hypothetical protein SISNIDRAFT_482984 [Sistotremastrum niveocremeum HHB9708]|uniref:Peptidase C14 caspase domain-containing protein n=1 Tax=Sistotremastrum niveocremeum HHB9708 TaxID=1314777 RepID=A0A164XYU1_9AGAM|nr:hypothetical protein SISNIDRAFT_482984 [Sistotremastrum niveocremeum HHB9708]
MSVLSLPQRTTYAGTKRALCIGLEYKHSTLPNAPDELPGTHSDAKSMAQLLIEKCGYLPENVRVVLDDGQQPMPNKHVIEGWLRWLRRGARPGDTLFLYRALALFIIASIIVIHTIPIKVACHGVQKHNLNGEETDRYDEVVVDACYQFTPETSLADDTIAAKTEVANHHTIADHSGAGRLAIPNPKIADHLSQYAGVRDDLIHKILVKGLPPGVKLIAVIDACHSGSMLDLHNSYHANRNRLTKILRRLGHIIPRVKYKLKTIFGRAWTMSIASDDDSILSLDEDSRAMSASANWDPDEAGISAEDCEKDSDEIASRSLSAFRRWFHRITNRQPISEPRVPQEEDVSATWLCGLDDSANVGCFGPLCEEPELEENYDEPLPDVISIASTLDHQRAFGTSKGGVLTKVLLEAMNQNQKRTWKQLVDKINTDLHAAMRQMSKKFRNEPDCPRDVREEWVQQQVELRSLQPLICVAPYTRDSLMKRALCIGLQYENCQQDNPPDVLPGAHSDAESMRQLLINRQGYDEDNVKRLLDDGKGPAPNKHVIEQHLWWLKRGARAGDTLFLYLACHGDQKPNLNGEETDDLDEVVVDPGYEFAPKLKAKTRTWTRNILSFLIRGRRLRTIKVREEVAEHLRHFEGIRDDYIHKILVKDLPPGVRLIAVIDACHASSMLDLRHRYQSRCPKCVANIPHAPQNDRNMRVVECYHLIAAHIRVKARRLFDLFFRKGDLYEHLSSEDSILSTYSGCNGIGPPYASAQDDTDRAQDIETLEKGPGADDTHRPRSLYSRIGPRIREMLSGTCCQRTKWLLDEDPTSLAVGSRIEGEGRRCDTPEPMEEVQDATSGALADVISIGSTRDGHRAFGTASGGALTKVFLDAMNEDKPRSWAQLIDKLNVDLHADMRQKSKAFRNDPDCTRAERKEWIQQQVELRSLQELTEDKLNEIGSF